MSKSYKILISLIIGLLALSCTGRHHDKRLTAVAEIVTNNPKEALQRLDSIDTEQLTAADRHFYDFLTIKARDKAYVYHTSDSLILDVVSYYSSHDKARYPEALYYGGRVYSDLGDYPTALRYFQEALDQLPADTKDLDLKCRLLSQTGRLLNTLRLYKEAIPYIESSIELNRPRHDTINTIYDLQLLASICIRAKMYEEAEKYLVDALDLGTNFPQEHEATSKMYLAQIKYETGQIDYAVSLIRHIPSQVDSIVRNTALANAAYTYHKAGILDTAYMYADELIHSKDHLNKECGYHVILSSELLGTLPIDSLSLYLSNYTRLLNSYYNYNEAQLAINQEALYNYQIHDRDRDIAEKTKDALKNWLIVAMGCITLLSCTLFYLKHRSTTKIIQLQQALENITRLKNEAEKTNSASTATAAETAQPLPSLSLSTSAPTEEELREKLRSELISLSETYKDNYVVSSVILKSKAYTQLQELIKEERILKDTDPLWKELERVILEAYPKFLKNLTVLTSGKIRTVELQTALLVKCGLRPSQMMILLGKTNGTINSRRETLGAKVFDKKVSVKEIDNLIRLL